MHGIRSVTERPLPLSSHLANGQSYFFVASVIHIYKCTVNKSSLLKYQLFLPYKLSVALTEIFYKQNFKVKN